MRERRRYERSEAHEEVRLSHDDGGHDVSGTIANISLGGAFIHAERFLAEGSELAFLVTFPRETLRPAASRAFCRAKVLRLGRHLIEGRFGVALRFVSVQALSEG